MRLHLIDGTFELFRAHFAKRPGHRTPAGLEAKAVVGLASSLSALLHDPAEAVTHAAIAFDNPIRSFRNGLFPGYKTEEGVPPELLAQLDAAEEAAGALGLVVWPMREFEADDALASAAARFRDRVEQVRILSPDKDLGQCLRGTRVVQVDRVRDRVIDEAALRARRGIAPESVPDFLALVGDDADGIPGLAGFGEKTAGALLASHLHLEEIPREARRWPASVRGAAGLAATLSSDWESALLYRRLATLVSTVPLAGSLDDLRWPGIPRDRFEDVVRPAGRRPAARGGSAAGGGPGGLERRDLREEADLQGEGEGDDGEVLHGGSPCPGLYGRSRRLFPLRLVPERSQGESGQHLVTGPPRGEMGPEERDLPGPPPDGIGGRRAGDGAAQPGGAASIAGSTDRDMRGERPPFHRESQRREPAPQVPGKRSQAGRVARQPQPDHPRPPRAGEPTGPVHLEPQRPRSGRRPGHRLAHGVQPLLRHGAEELQRDVETVGRGPAHLVGVAPGASPEVGLPAGQLAPHRVGRVEGREESQVQVARPPRRLTPR